MEYSDSEFVWYLEVTSTNLFKQLSNIEDNDTKHDDIMNY